MVRRIASIITSSFLSDGMSMIDQNEIIMKLQAITEQDKYEDYF